MSISNNVNESLRGYTERARIYGLRNDLIRQELATEHAEAVRERSDVHESYRHAAFLLESSMPATWTAGYDQMQASLADAVEIRRLPGKGRGVRQTEASQGQHSLLVSNRHRENQGADLECQP
jgi:hypothetical protein